jgi:CBS domain containing-hemolysin-like protein
VLAGVALAAAVLFGTLRRSWESFSVGKMERWLERNGPGGRLAGHLEHGREVAAFCLVLQCVAYAGLFAFLLALFAGILEAVALPAIAAAAAAWAALFGLVEVVAAGVSEEGAERVVAASAGTLAALRYLLWPLVRALAWLGEAVERALTPHPADPSEELEEEIMSVVSEGEREGAIENDEKRMIEGILDFHDADVAKIMTPRTEMAAIEEASPPERAVALVAESGFSRLPVYRATRDNIVGVLYAKDVLCRSGESTGTIADLMRKPYFVPETKRIGRLLQEFKTKKVHIAIVIDEYGGTAGLVTVEDILEEIVGEITDEYDSAEEAQIRVHGENDAEVDARTHIDEVNDALRIELPEDGDVDTIGGFVASHLGRIPVTGETFEHEGVRFVVLAAEERRINRLRIHVERRGEGEETAD